MRTMMRITLATVAFAVVHSALTPHMTTRRLEFNVVSTVYFVLGSAHESGHEEARLADAFRAAYRAYRHKGMPFFWPSLSVVKTTMSAFLPRKSA